MNPCDKCGETDRGIRGECKECARRRAKAWALDNPKPLRGNANSRRTHCGKGHEYTSENTRWYGPDKKWRKCKTCSSEDNKKYRAKPGNKEKIDKRVKEYHAANPEKSSEYHKRAYYEHQEWLNELKNRPCEDCGGSFPPCAMDFDHRDPSEKLVNVARCRSKERALAEIAKCDLVCANCHRIRTWMPDANS